MILGNRSFIKEALSHLGPKNLRRKDTSSRRSLKMPLSMEEIADIISRTLDVPREQMIDKKGPYRNLALYFMRRSTGFTNREIGQFFGNITYSAVTKAYQRFEEALKSDKNLRDMIEKLGREMSQCKG